MIRLYFAYGSNMNPARIAARGLRVLDAMGARLAGMQLVFDKAAQHRSGTAHANLAHAPSVSAVTRDVEGVLYELAGPDDIRSMDAFEGVPVSYSRDVVVVDVAGTRRPAWTYFANPAVRRDGLRPAREYLEHLLKGRPYLSEAYFAWLSRTRCSDEP